MLILNAAAHFLMDATCAAALFGSGVADMTTMLLLYNTLAFSSQCLVGLITDQIGHCRLLTAASCLCGALAFFLPLPPMGKAALVGAANSVFHVAAGSATLEKTRGKAASLGIFVAPGSLGLVLGTLYPGYGFLFGLLLALCGTGAAFVKEGGSVPGAESAPEAPEHSGLPAALLLMAVAVRAVGGSAVTFPWKTGPALSVLMACYVLTGKAIGGFLCDKLGPGRTALLSLPLAALLLAFGAESMGLSLIGQLLLNLTMPVTLLLLYRCLPDAPGFSFGLAASALWPGTIAGQFIGVSGTIAPFLLIACFAFGLAAILYTAKGERYEKVA